MMWTKEQAERNAERWNANRTEGKHYAASTGEVVYRSDFGGAMAVRREGNVVEYITEPEAAALWPESRAPWREVKTVAGGVVGHVLNYDDLTTKRLSVAAPKGTLATVKLVAQVVHDEGPGNGIIVSAGGTHYAVLREDLVKLLHDTPEPMVPAWRLEEAEKGRKLTHDQLNWAERECDEANQRANRFGDECGALKTAVARANEERVKVAAENSDLRRELEKLRMGKR